MIDIIMRYGNGELLRKAIAQGSIITARTSIPKELKPKEDGYPKVPVTLWLKKGDTSKLHTTGMAKVKSLVKNCNGCESPLLALCKVTNLKDTLGFCIWSYYSELAGFGIGNGKVWYDAFCSFHPRWKGGTVYFIKITEIRSMK